MKTLLKLFVLLMLAGHLLAASDDPFITYSFFFELSANRDTIYCIVTTNSFSEIRAISSGLILQVSNLESEKILFSGVQWNHSSAGLKFKTFKQRNGFVRFFAIGSSQWPISSEGGELFRFTFIVDPSYTGDFRFLSQSRFSFSMVNVENDIVLKDRPFTKEDVNTSQISEMSVFPNPGQGVYTMFLKLRRPAAVRYEVYDMNGRQIFSFVQSLTVAGEFSRRVDIETLSSGVYLFRTISEFLDGNIHSVARKVLKIR